MAKAAKKSQEVEPDFDEINSSTVLQKSRRGDRKVKKQLVSGAEFHDWKNDPYFVGRYSGDKVLAEKDDVANNRKAGDVMGYIFSTEDGEEVIIGASYSITKAIEQVEKGALLEITFEGKKAGKGGKMFNHFSVCELE